MIEPVYTCAGLGFIIGVVFGISLCAEMSRRANKSLDEAHRLLSQAIDKEKRSTAFYQAATRNANKALETWEQVKRLLQDESPRA